MPQGPAPFPQSVQVREGGGGDLHHRVGKAGAAKLHIGAEALAGAAQQIHHAGIRQAHLILLPGDPAGADQTGSGAEADDPAAAGQTVLQSVAGDTSGAVAAHLPEGAVGIQKVHGEVRLRVRLQDDQTVRPGTGERGAKPQGEAAEILALKLAVQVL